MQANRATASSVTRARVGVCTMERAPHAPLNRVATRLVAMPGRPVGVVTTSDGQWSFVALKGTADQIGVISDRPSPPRLARTVSLPRSGVAGLTLTRDGRYLLAASESGAVVISVDRAERGSSQPVLGSLYAEPPAASRGRAAGGGAAEVLVTPDHRFAFVSLEARGRIAVFDLAAALADGFRHASLVGQIPLGIAPIGLALSPDGRWLYATSEARSGSLGDAPSAGLLSVIDARRARQEPASSVIANVGAGCSPVRVITSPDGRVVWVSARSSDELLAFSAEKLRRDPSNALIAAHRVGAAPLALALVDHGKRIVVADSNYSGAPGARSGLSVLDTAQALAGKPALLGVIKASRFPREMSVTPNGETLLVTNFASAQLEAVALVKLP